MASRCPRGEGAETPIWLLGALPLCFNLWFFFGFFLIFTLHFVACPPSGGKYIWLFCCGLVVMTVLWATELPCGRPQCGYQCCWLHTTASISVVGYARLLVSFLQPRPRIPTISSSIGIPIPCARGLKGSGRCWRTRRTVRGSGKSPGCQDSEQ